MSSCKAVTIINTYIKTLDVILKQLDNTQGTALHNMGLIGDPKIKGILN